MALYVVMLLWVVDGCWQHTLNFKTAGKGWGQGVVPSRRSVCSCFLLFLVRYVGCSRLEGGRCVYVRVRACVCVFCENCYHILYNSAMQGAHGSDSWRGPTKLQVSD